jgi:hypothetical protein
MYGQFFEGYLRTTAGQKTEAKLRGLHIHDGCLFSQFLQQGMGLWGRARLGFAFN